jgi:hypothetical protein
MKPKNLLTRSLQAAAVFTALVLTGNAAATPTTINGPVAITVGGSNYDVYYTTVLYTDVVAQYTQTIGPSVTASTTTPTTLIGIADAVSIFSQPWWDSSDVTGASAQAAAIAWYNASGFPVNQGVQLPNGGQTPSNGSQTPYFAFNTGNNADEILYAYAYFDAGTSQVVSSTATADILADTYSYALAGAAVAPPPPPNVPAPSQLLLMLTGLLSMSGAYWIRKSAGKHWS